MVDLLGIAAIRQLHRAFRQVGLDVHDRLGIGRGFCRGLARELEHALYVLHVIGAELHGLGIRVGVVIAIGHPQSALVSLCDHLRRVLEVLARVEAENRVHAVVVQISEQFGQLLGILQFVDTIELGLEDRDAFLVDGGLVHAGGIVVTNLLLVCECASDRPPNIAPGSCAGSLVAIFQLVETAPTRLIRRDRMVLHPIAAGELIEISAGVSGAIERVQSKPLPLVFSAVGAWEWFEKTL